MKFCVGESASVTTMTFMLVRT